MQYKTRKCATVHRARRYAAKMAKRGWVLVGPITRSGIINKRYMVTLQRP